MKKLTKKDLDKLTEDGLKVQILTMQDTHQAHIDNLTREHRRVIDRYSNCLNYSLKAQNARKARKVLDELSNHIQVQMDILKGLGFQAYCEHWGNGYY